jgi:hypothetical protein
MPLAPPPLLIAIDADYLEEHTADHLGGFARPGREKYALRSPALTLLTDVVQIDFFGLHFPMLDADLSFNCGAECGVIVSGATIPIGGVGFFRYPVIWSEQY